MTVASPPREPLPVEPPTWLAPAVAAADWMVRTVEQHPQMVQARPAVARARTLLQRAPRVRAVRRRVSGADRIGDPGPPVDPMPDSEADSWAARVWERVRQGGDAAYRRLVEAAASFDAELERLSERWRETWAEHARIVDQFRQGMIDLADALSALPGQAASFMRGVPLVLLVLVVGYALTRRNSRSD